MLDGVWLVGLWASGVAGWVVVGWAGLLGGTVVELVGMLAMSGSASLWPEAMRAATSYVVSSLPRAERSALAGRSKLKKLLVRWRLRAAERATSLPVPTGCRSASPTRLSDDSRAATAKPTSIAMTAFAAVVCRRGGDGICEGVGLADRSCNEMP